jgi:hypothetical protein
VVFGEWVGLVGSPFDEVVWGAGKDGAEFVEVLEFECGGFGFGDVVSDGFGEAVLYEEFPRFCDAAKAEYFVQVYFQHNDFGLYFELFG